MTTHTPGPWEAREGEDYVSVKPVRADIALIDVASVYGRTDAERLANAKVMAAGPELLGALEQACSHCPCSVRERESGHRVGCAAPEWAALIAKVR